MENEIMEEIPSLEIGKDVPPITAKRIVIEKVYLKEVKGKDGKDWGKKVVLFCRHPDKKETLQIDKVKYNKNDSLKTSALWFKQDDEGKLAKNSALGNMLVFLNVKNTKELPGTQSETTLDDEGYLAIKAY